MPAAGLNLPGAGFRVINNSLTPGGGSPVHSGGLKPATDPNRVLSDVHFLLVGRPRASLHFSQRQSQPCSTLLIYTLPQHTHLSPLVADYSCPIYTTCQSSPIFPLSLHISHTLHTFTASS
ncbi:unnamed protein product [Protopolystoma xenopodis]|uniref:Uncharacterized protein n=1 Tax=Protopolystoma xenopodis TaxID=117903 RepID=A0A3S5CJT1_9PLAT|nr:unnamed protein product [Protopolystoma xenopodis]